MVPFDRLLVHQFLTEDIIMNVKRACLFLIVLFGLFIIPVRGHAQSLAADRTQANPPGDALTDTLPSGPARNSIYAEAGGSSIGGTFDYERMVVRTLAVRLGFGYLPLSGTKSNGTVVHASITSAPLTLSWFPFSASDSASSDRLEIGIGLGYADLSRNLGPFKEFNGIGYSAIIGYRYEPVEGGFLFRIAFTPILLGGNFQPYGGISFGWGF